MRYRHGLIASLVTLGACTEPLVNVTPLHPTPRCIMARAVESVKVFTDWPPNSVAVYGIVASEGSASELHAAIQAKAAGLGCDGILIVNRDAAGHTRGEAATGQLTEHKELVAERVTAVCIVLAN